VGLPHHAEDGNDRSETEDCSSGGQAGQSLCGSRTGRRALGAFPDAARSQKAASALGGGEGAELFRADPADELGHLAATDPGIVILVGTNVLIIGAHAAVLDLPLATVDVDRYRTYFPLVKLICP